MSDPVYILLGFINDNSCVYQQMLAVVQMFVCFTCDVIRGQIFVKDRQALVSFAVFLLKIIDHIVVHLATVLKVTKENNLIH